MMKNNPNAATAIIKVRVTPAEKEAYAAAAAREGIKLSQLVREALEERCGHSLEDDLVK